MAKAHRTLPTFPQQHIQRFNSYVSRSDGCWEWSGGRFHNGYGAFQHKLKTYRAHRVAYFLSRGEQPAEFEVCHTCDNPACCRPDHLFLGTRQDNIDDCGNKGRRYRGARHHFKRKPPIGETNSRAIVNEAIVREIRAAYAPRKVSQESLGKKYGLSRGAVDSIVRRRNWKHIS